jgi:SepF-like predicted cell division protein (DUF552 family)
MIVDIDTRKLDLKKGDMLIFDGKQVAVISKDELIKPILEELKKLRQDVKGYIAIQESNDKKIKKIDKFIRTLGGFKNEKD